MSKPSEFLLIKWLEKLGTLGYVVSTTEPKLMVLQYMATWTKQVFRPSLEATQHEWPVMRCYAFCRFLLLPSALSLKAGILDLN